MKNKLWLGSILAFGLVIALGARPSLAQSPSTPEKATKTIVIKSTTKQINVMKNETVRFEVSAKQFAILFNGNQTSYDLSKIGPAGVLTHKVEVYVTPDDHRRP